MFTLGEIIITDKAREFLSQHGQYYWEAAKLILRHHTCDWGEVGDERVEINETNAKENTTPILSRYEFLGCYDRGPVYVLTEDNEEGVRVTTVSLWEDTSEYTIDLTSD